MQENEEAAAERQRVLEEKDQGYERDFPDYKKLKDQVDIYMNICVYVCMSLKRRSKDMSATFLSIRS
jgi:hypothetical protein